MDFNKVLDAIATMNKGQLRTVGDVMRQRYAMLNAAAKAAFTAGHYVRFADKHGAMVYGTVKKVMRKNLRVTATNGVIWTVSPSLCTRINDLPGWA